ncbi:MAG TPA: hypothetical protein VE960_02060 [bacterium]|nr:hypothetical protein [bacterium]
MVYGLMRLGGVRYVGDTSTWLVHDRWHKDSQGCGLTEIVERGHAVGFKPDTLDAAFLESYDYCEACHDKTDPEQPSWARLAELSDDETDDEEESLLDVSPGERDPAARDEAAASRPEREKAKATG